MKDPIVLYHANCLDGLGAAWAARDALGKGAILLPCQYGQTDPEVLLNRCRDRDVYVLDFSFPVGLMEAIQSVAKRLVWIDHHETSIERIGPFFEVGPTTTLVLAEDKCGALLTWEYFNPGTPAPPLLRILDDYDRFTFKMGGTLAINLALKAMGDALDTDVLGALIDGEEVQLGILAARGGPLADDLMRRKDDVIKTAAMPLLLVLPDGEEVQGLAANCFHDLANWVGHDLALASGSFGATYYMDKEGKLRFSLRSDGAVNCAKAAEAFGGGGHQKAAGFSVWPGEVLQTEEGPAAICLAAPGAND